MLTLMVLLKHPQKFLALTLSTVLLAACGVAAPVPTATVTIMPSLTQAIPTATVSLPTPSSTSTAVSSLPVSSAPDGLRMAYIIDGNLYFQDGSKPPLQLTHSEDDRYPVFSDDGEKIIFYRGLVLHELHSINIDGTQEQVLITGSLLEVLGLRYDKFTEIISLAFVPGTHQVLFNTRQLSQADIDQKDFNRLGSKENSDLLSVNIDTGEIKSLLPRGKGGSFFISPDGNMVAVQAQGHIDVMYIDGQMIHSNLITYTPTHPYILALNVSWNSDSTELIVSLPARDVFDMSGPEAYSIWRYAVDGSAKAQLTFDPPPLDNCCASPNGEWFLYSYYYYPGKTSETIPSGLYLSNLQNSSVQFYHPNYLYYHWSLDSLGKPPVKS